MRAELESELSHSVSVAGIVVNAAGQVLAIRRGDNGQWQPPGGVLETQETFEEGVLREITEETGAQVEIEHLSGLYKNVKAGIIANVFRCRPLTEPATETAEAAEVAWLNPADVPHLMTPTFTPASSTHSRQHPRSGPTTAHTCSISGSGPHANSFDEALALPSESRAEVPPSASPGLGDGRDRRHVPSL
jgi:ADP-ribose pyrophosphatase YjhB (NUDIX family)